jgi:predicted Fe-Mo cluster-binding NifX family protein
MKIAITATAPELDAKVDPRFGRCPFFLIVETDDLSFEAMENPNITQGSGAGIQSAQLMVDKGVQHVLTGNCGPNAHQTLAAANIAVSVGCSGSIREVAEQFKAGQFTASTGPNVAGHYGTSGAFPEDQAGAGPAPFTPGMGQGRGMGGGRGMEMGRGMGMGRGGGRGMGGGMGRGRGMGAGADVVGDPVPPVDPGQDELTTLKQQAQAMSQQMPQIQQRIQQLEKEKE